MVTTSCHAVCIMIMIMIRLLRVIVSSNSKSHDTSLSTPWNTPPTKHREVSTSRYTYAAIMTIADFDPL